MQKINFILPVVCSAATGFICFVAGTIFQKKKDLKGTKIAGTMQAYIPPYEGEEALLFAEPGINVEEILKNGQATFRIVKIKSAK